MNIDLSQYSSKRIQWIYTLLIWSMFVGMMWSRALLSIVVVILPVLTIWKCKQNILELIKGDRWLRGAVLMFTIPLISMLWALNPENGWKTIMNQSMLWLLPLGLIGIKSLDSKWRVRTLIGVALIHFVIMLEVGTHFILDYEYWIKKYNTMGTLSIGKYNDHIRFTLSLLLLNVLLFQEVKKTKNNTVLKKIIFPVFLVFSILFIHLLASKSGVVLLYLGFFVVAFLWIKQSKTKVILLTLMLGLMAVFYVVTPTFKKKIELVKYQWEEYQHKKTLNYQHSDHGRIISYEVGLEAATLHPWWGVGAGGALAAMKPIYQEKYPEIPEDAYIIPHNQWLNSILSYGFIVGVIYPFLLIVPWKRRTVLRNKGEVLSLFLIFASMIPEATLEAQFGVFIAAFYLSWQRVIAIN